MPTLPRKVNLSASSDEILNKIWNNASANYQRNVTARARDSLDTLHLIGQQITSNTEFANEFLNILNRIAMTLISSKLYTNPWSMFKRGVIEYGETVEEIFVNLAKPHTYNMEYGVSHQWDIETPDVRAALHMLNYREFYKTTVTHEQLRLAFLSWEGVRELITGIIQSLYTAAAYDEYIVMKYMIVRNVLNGYFYPVSVKPTTSDNLEDIVGTMKGVSSDLEFMSSLYNPAGVTTFTNKSSQILIYDTHFDAKVSVEVLAVAFNEDRATFMGHVVLVDGFDKQDTQRLNKLFEGNPNYRPITEAELEVLKTISAVLVDKDYFMIFDNLLKMTEKYNGESLYWNYWLHVWKTFSSSPFANAIVFLNQNGTVTGVTISNGSTAYLAVGATLQLSATVATTGIISKDVVWTTADETKATISETGLVTGVAAGSVVITATSKADSTKSASITITVA